jgi:hypothetical protein
MPPQEWLEFFKYSPAIGALLIVVFLLYRLLIRRDELLEKSFNSQKEDVERQSKLIALLEILVNRGDKN